MRIAALSASYICYYSHSIVNKPRKACSGAGFLMVSSVNTMKNTMFNICC